MKAIYWDTSTEWIVIEIFEIPEQTGENCKVIYSFKEYLPRVASTGLVSLLHKALQYAHLDKPDWIFVAKGPGSFTGIRIAVATARNLSQLWNVPCMGLDTMEIYGNYYGQKHPQTDIAVLLDGKMNKYFARLVSGNFVDREDSRDSHFNNTMDLPWEEIQPLISEGCKIFSHTNLTIPYTNFQEDYPTLTGVPTTSYWNHSFINLAKDSQKFHYETLLPNYMRETYATKPIPKS